MAASIVAIGFEVFLENLDVKVFLPTFILPINARINHPDKRILFSFCHTSGYLQHGFWRAVLSGFFLMIFYCLRLR